MAMEIRLQKQNGRMVPADHLSDEEVRSIGNGEYFTATLRRPRNLGHHRKYFALLTVIFDAQDRFPTTDGLLDFIKIGIGHCDWHKLKRGKTVIEYAVPRSINFARMGQKGFTEFYDNSVNFILKEILPGAQSEDLERRVLEILA